MYRHCVVSAACALYGALPHGPAKYLIWNMHITKFMYCVVSLYAYLQAETSHGFKWRRYTVSTCWFVTQSGEVVRAHSQAFFSSCCLGAIPADTLIDLYQCHVRVTTTLPQSLLSNTNIPCFPIVYITKFATRKRLHGHSTAQLKTPNYSTQLS